MRSTHAADSREITNDALHPACRRAHAARLAVHSTPFARAARATRAVLAGGAAGVLCGALGLPVHVAVAQTRSPLASAEVDPARAGAAALEARSEDGNSALLPLVGETARVRIEDGHATVDYEHTFQNESKQRLEGQYRLLVGEGATATGFAYYNGEQKIVGEIFERDEARSVYEALTGLRRDPGLLEQSGEGGFSFHVFPIEPGERKRIQVSTSRWLPRRNGALEYRVRLTRSDAAVGVVVSDSRGLVSMESPSHDIALERTSATSWTARVGAPKHADTELVLRYETAAAPLTLSSRVHRDSGQDAFFTATLATPMASAPAERIGHDVTLVLDRSGSMEGPSIESARAAAKALVARLSPSDRLNVVVFDDKVDALWNAPRPIDDETRRVATDYIGKIRAGGGTDIAKALAKALGLQIHDDHPDVVVFLTDGQSDGVAATKVASADTSDARVFTVGLGSGVDKALLSRLAAIRHGRFTFVSDPKAVEVELPRVLTQLEDPVLTNVTVSAEGGRIERLYPATPPDLFAADELRVFGRVTGSGPVKLVVTGKDKAKADRRFETTLDPSGRQAAPFVARSWARARVDDVIEEIREKGDDAGERKNEAIELGLAYGLVTEYTSFLAIPETELTEAAKSAVGSMRDKRKRILAAHKDAAALSRLNMPPGDPILKVKAPKDARRVTAMFPFGLVQDLAWDDFSESWTTRFLVPQDVADGTYAVPVVIVNADGTVTSAEASYTIDAKAAGIDVDVRPCPGGAQIRVTVDEAAQEVRVVELGRPKSAMALPGDGVKRMFSGTLALPPGKHALRVVVADLARNESERVIEVEVPQ